MSCYLSLRAAEVLGCLIENACPELVDQVCAGPSDTGHKRTFPYVAIVPINFKFSPDQEDVWAEVGDSRAIIDVGRYDALYQIQVGSKNKTTRARLMDAITALFFQTEARPGVLVVEIVDCHNAVVGYELESHTWENEAGFSDKWVSITTVNVVTPVLIERGSVYTMQEIRMMLAAEQAASIEKVSDDVRETVAVDENGNVTMSVPFPPP